MKQKQQMRLEIKEISAEGSFEGMLSPYNNVDGGADMVLPGAYTKTLQEHGSKVPLLWQHKTDVPIGDLTLEDRPEGLWCSGQLLMPLAEAQKAYLLIKAKIVKGLSIGFESIKDSVENGVRRLKEIRLYEGSIVTFPMNESALISSVKARAETKEDFSTELAEIQLQDMGYQMFYALRCALGSIPWAAGMTRDEKVAAAEVTLSQFHDAFMAYLPAYLDYLTEEYGSMETMSADQIETKRMERKAGAKHSVATKQTVQDACEHMTKCMESAKSANDLLLALIGGEADTEDEPGDTSESKAAPVKSEPEAEVHSAVLFAEIKKLKEAFTWKQ